MSLGHRSATPIPTKERAEIPKIQDQESCSETVSTDPGAISEAVWLSHDSLSQSEVRQVEK
jgi:hypothetical protein